MRELSTLALTWWKDSSFLGKYNGSFEGNVHYHINIEDEEIQYGKLLTCSIIPVTRSKLFRCTVNFFPSRFKVPIWLDVEIRTYELK
jgi:hypothetical protein